MKLNVTNDGSIMSWIGYDMIDGYPVEVAWGTLDDLREWALCNGYSGVLIGSPSTGGL